MSKFEVGSRVIVTGVTLYGSFEGCEGVIIKQGMFHDWLVDVTFPDGTHDDLSFDTDELTPAPTVGGAAVDLSPADDYAKGYNAGLLDGYAGVDTDWVTRYENHLATLQAQLAAANALAQTNADLLANAQHELSTVRGERDAAVAWSKTTEQNWQDCGNALAAILKERGVSELTIGGYYIYEAIGNSADAFPVDGKGNRIHAQARQDAGTEGG